jgi:hypothetical protein
MSYVLHCNLGEDFDKMNNSFGGRLPLLFGFTNELSEMAPVYRISQALFVTLALDRNLITATNTFVCTEMRPFGHIEQLLHSSVSAVSQLTQNVSDEKLLTHNTRSFFFSSKLCHLI